MKLTLRDLFWLTAFVALALVWWMEHSRQVQLRLAAGDEANQCDKNSMKWESRGDLFKRYMTEELGVRISADEHGFTFPPQAMHVLLQEEYGWKFEREKTIPPPGWPNIP